MLFLNNSVKRLVAYIYGMSCLIDKENDIEMKQAYTEMPEGCLLGPDCRIWHAAWYMELKNAPGTIVDMKKLIQDMMQLGLGNNTGSAGKR